MPSSFKENDVEACELTIRRHPWEQPSGCSQASASFSSFLVQASELAGLVRSQGCAPAQPAASPAGGPVAMTPSNVAATASAGHEVRFGPRTVRKGASPGPSNTRAITPPDACGLARPLLLQASVDALKLAFRAALAETELARMARILDAGEPAGYEVFGEEFELKSLGGRIERFVLTNSSSTVCVGRDVNGFCITVDLRAMFLRTTPLADALEYAQGLARRFAATPFAEVRVRRVDLCADATGLAFSREDEDKFVTRARRRIRFQCPERVYTRKRARHTQLTGFAIAPGNSLHVRIYDKTEELLAVQGKDSEKTRTELAAFHAAGWDGQSPVWRVEGQLRSDVLRELDAASPERLVRSLDSLWHYTVGVANGEGRAWLRLVERGTSTRIERCKTDARWRVYQAACFSGRASVERVPGRRGGVAHENMLGSVLSALGATSNLHDGDPEESARELMLRDFERAAELIAANPHLLKTYRRRRAAARGRHWVALKVAKGAS